MEERPESRGNGPTERFSADSCGSSDDRLRSRARAHASREQQRTAESTWRLEVERNPKVGSF